MWQLNLPLYNFRIKNQNDKQFIFDAQRRKFVSLTPEEWVRQHFIRFLIEEKKYPAAWIAIEKQLNINGMKKRCDAIVYDEFAKPLVLIEFKAPEVPITQATFDQAVVYNLKLNVSFFIISNGLQHYACKIDFEAGKYLFFQEIPDFASILSAI
ncbi:MAG: type I restriction enzyme HsdR N-terminal domain-containing protein [Paludibacter sp.]|jgi:type I site-specific restriction endonuclease|nr:type I restriction enzyme HsdR N-terminal domain-containing protein [Paludibacter sp.]MDD3490320.1 type I restriction enzyme HsdR N-terminal domain-containing protein [Paludibacter sp.]